MQNFINDKFKDSTPIKLTKGLDDQQLYFTGPSITEDGNYMVFISDRGGNPNLWSKNLHTGDEKLLSQNKNGTLRSYQYFNGNFLTGFGKASVSFDPKRAITYYIQDNQVMSVDLNGKIRVICRLPDKQMTAYTSLSKDGSLICVPTTDARAFETNDHDDWKPKHNIDARMQNECLNSYLRIYDVMTGKEIMCEVVPKGWITHVQFCPSDNKIILYNNEWPSFKMGFRRLWIWDGKKHYQLRTQNAGCSEDDWVCHEMWSHDGSRIIYHGTHAHSNMHYVGSITIDDNEIIEIPMPEGFNEYGHFSIGKNDLLVSDGYYRDSQDRDKKKELRDRLLKISRSARSVKLLIPKFVKKWLGKKVGVSTDFGEWICILNVNWDNKLVEWIPLCKHNSTNCRTEQDSHPHPVFHNHVSGCIYFTSNFGGRRAIYSVETPQELL